MVQFRVTVSPAATDTDFSGWITGSSFSPAPPGGKHRAVIYSSLCDPVGFVKCLSATVFIHRAHTMSRPWAQHIGYIISLHVPSQQACNVRPYCKWQNSGIERLSDMVENGLECLSPLWKCHASPNILGCSLSGFMDCCISGPANWVGWWDFFRQMICEQRWWMYFVGYAFTARTVMVHLPSSTEILMLMMGSVPSAWKWCAEIPTHNEHVV